jgi:hypothetical protein
MGQLLGLAAADSGSAAEAVEREAADLFVEYVGIVRDRLNMLATQDNAFAARMLALMDEAPREEELVRARVAAEVLTAPLQNKPGVYGIGTGAVRHSVLASKLPADERLPLVRAQLERVRSPHEPASNRSEYLLAAANLAQGLGDVDELFIRAMELAPDPSPSQADLAMGSWHHPLGAIHVTGVSSDTRPEALYLAAALAQTTQQRTQVRDVAFTLLTASEDAGYYVTHTLQLLKPGDLNRDVPLLAVHADWALRSLAAITWVANEPQDLNVGFLLADDADPRVRRALAHAVARNSTTQATRQVKEKLRTDRRASVRRLL